MRMLSDISELARGWRRRSWPVGAGTVDAGDRYWGHADQYVPAEYGEYVATSNEVYAVASLRARLMSGLPLRLFRGHDTDKIATSQHRAAELLRRVNPFWTWPRLARMDELSMCVWGKTFWALQPGPDRLPAEIWWMRGDRVRPVPHETGYLTGFLYEPIHGGSPIPFEPHEVVWFRYPHPLDEFSALSPLVAARLAADSASAMQRSNKLLFDQGLMGGGIITPTSDKIKFTSDQARDLERQFAARMKGVDRSHRWSVLRFEAQMQAISVSPKDAEFVAGLGLNLRQICNAYGIPSPLLNDLDQANLAILDGLTRSMWSHTLVPDAQLRSAEIVEQLLPRFASTVGAPDHAEFDFTQVAALQESQSESWAREAQALDRGALTINEWRTRRGLPTVPWGDVWWAPVNKAAVTGPDSAPQGDTMATTLPSTEHNPDDQIQQGIDDIAAARLLGALRPINGWRH